MVAHDLAMPTSLRTYVHGLGRLMMSYLRHCHISQRATRLPAVPAYQAGVQSCVNKATAAGVQNFQEHEALLQQVSGRSLLRVAFLQQQGISAAPAAEPNMASPLYSRSFPKCPT